MLSMAIKPSVGSFKSYTFTYPLPKLIAKIPCKNSIVASPKASSFRSPTLSDLKFNRDARRFIKLCASSASAVEAVAEEAPTEDLTSSTQPEKQKLGVVVKPMQKPMLLLKFVWMEKNIGLAINQVIPGHGTIPLSPYYFWPRKDA